MLNRNECFFIEMIIIVLIMITIPEIGCSEDVRTNVLKAMIDPDKVKVYPMGIVYRYDQFVIYLSTLYFYIGKRSDIKLGNGKFHATLYSRGVFDSRFSKTLFVYDICGLELDQVADCEYAARDIYMFRWENLTTKSSYFIGVFDYRDVAVGLVAVMKIYTLSKFEPIYREMVVRNMNMVFGYKPLIQMTMFIYLLKPIDKKEKYYVFRMNPPTTLNIVKPDELEYCQAMSERLKPYRFMFFFGRDKVAFFDHTKTVDFKKIINITDGDYFKDKNGLCMIQYFGDEEGSTGYYSHIDRKNYDNETLASLFDISESGADGTMNTEDNWTGSVETEFYPHMTELKNRFLMLFIILLLVLIIFIIIGIFIMTQNRQHRRRRHRNHVNKNDSQIPIIIINEQDTASKKTTTQKKSLRGFSKGISNYKHSLELDDFKESSTGYSKYATKEIPKLLPKLLSKVTQKMMPLVLPSSSSGNISNACHTHTDKALKKTTVFSPVSSQSSTAHMLNKVIKKTLTKDGLIPVCNIDIKTSVAKNVNSKF